MWQIKAEEVVDDKELQIVEYHDAVMEIDGIPVFYTPYFSHPDPSVKRASGFLPPTSAPAARSASTPTIPYYWVIAPDKDATFRPISRPARASCSTASTASASATASIVERRQHRGRQRQPRPVVDGQSPSRRPAPVRGHFFGTGEWDLTDDWRAGYDVQRESDQTYMLRYHFPTPSNYLTTQPLRREFRPDSYGNISA